MEHTSIPDRRYALTIYENHKNPAGKSASATIPQLIKLLSTREIRDSKFGKAFSPYKLKAGTTRGNDNVEFFSMAVVDVDDGSELRFLRSTLAPYMWFAYSSHNHTEEHHKYRIVLPLASDVSPDVWPTLWAGLSQFVQGHNDPAVKDLSRLYFTPSCSEANKDIAFYEYHEGAPIDPQTLIDMAPEVEAPSHKPKHKPKVANAFAAAVSYADSYSDVIAEHCASMKFFKDTGCAGTDMEPLWWKLVGVLKHTVDGEQKAHEWSAQYEGYDSSETQSKLDNWTHGPATCDTIKSLKNHKCSGCEKTCKSPIQLGHVVETKPPSMEEDEAEEIAPDDVLTKEELLKKIWPTGFIEDKQGRLAKSVTQPDGSVQHVAFCDTVFYPVNLIQNEEEEWEAVVEYRAKHGKLRRFRMLTSAMSSPDKLAAALAAHTIFLYGKGGGPMATEFMRNFVLNLQEHKQEVITEDAFGWTLDNSGFIIGTTEVNLTSEKPVLLSEQIKSGGMARDYGVSGTRAEWVRLVDEVYNRPGAEIYQFAFLVAAASPLIAMAGIDGFHGIPVAYTGEGGRGKTTACRVACSIWGNGSHFTRSANSAGSTVNSLLARTAIFKNLPWVMDEMTGQKTEELADMLYALSNGQGKSRLGPNGSFTSGDTTWDLFSFLTGNMDVTGLLANLDRQKAEAVSVRCFEIKVPEDFNETVFKGVNVKQLIDVELAKNYGIVGRDLIRFYMKHRVKIVDGIHKMRQKYSPVTADQTRERFYIDLICFAMVAGRCMEKLGLIKFDLEAIKKAMFHQVKMLRRSRTERQFTGTDMVGAFITSLHEHTIVTKHVVDARRNTAAEIPLDQLRGEPLARKATVDKRFVIAAKAIQDWGKENNVAPTVLRNELDKQGFILHIQGKSDPVGGFNWRLGAGTTRTTGLARCFELDFAKVHGFDVGDREENDNVTPIRPVPNSVPTKETAPEGAAASA